MSYSGYNTRFYFRFESQAGREFRIDIKKLGYTGSAQQRPLGQTPVLKRESGDNGVHGTSLEIYAVCKTDGEYAELYTSSAREYLVVLSEVSGGTTTALWHGFITPELYAEPEVAPPYDVQIVATDGLGELKLYDFAAAGRVSLYTHLYNLLSTTGLDCAQSDIVVVNSLACTTPSVNAANLLTGIYVDLDHLAGESTQYDALVGILSSLHMSITRYADKWLLYRESDIAVSSGTIAARNAAGVATTLPVAQYGSMQSRSWWPVGRVDTEVEPAKNRVAVASPFNMKESMFVNPNLPDGTGWMYPTHTPGAEHYVTWIQFAGGEMRPNLFNTATRGSTTIYQDITVDAYDGPLTLRILTALYSEADAQTYSVFFRLRLTASGATYYLKRRDLGESYEWGTTDTEIEYQAERLSGYTGTSQIPISAFNENAFGIPGLPASGTLRIEITSKSKNFSLLYRSQDFYLGGVFLLQDAVPGYKDIIVIDNDARGGNNDISIEFCDSQYVANALKNFYNIASNSVGVACSAWADARYSGELLSVISMDYALGVALPRLNAKGTLNIPSSAQVPMAFVNPDGITMLVRESSWKILSDDLEVQLISLPVASLTIISETITELTEEEAVSAGGSGGSSHSGGSSGGGGGSSSSKYFEDVLDDTTGELVGAKALYDLYIIKQEADEQEETEEILGNISEILRHLTLGNSNGTPYLICDIALGSAGQTFSGGYAPGGGGGGGSIATLNDVTLTNLADGQILQYNATSSHWENKNLTLSLLIDVSSDTPQNGQALIYNSSTGLWTPQAIQTGGGAISLLTDVQLTNLANGDTLVYNSAAEKWVNASGYATQTWVTNQGYLTSSSLSGYATQQWVTNQGYITSSALNGYATEQWITNKGYITSSALSGYATQSWVQNQNYLTSSDLNGYATQQWVTNKGYTTMAAVEAWAADEGFATQTWVTNQGYMSASNFTASNIVSTLGNTAVNRATADGDGNTISSTYLKLTGGTLTGDLRLKSGNYGLTLYFGDSSHVYLTEDTDDHLTINGSKGITLLTSSTSYSLVVGSSNVATPAAIYGNLTTYGNLTVGESSGTSACKTLTVYGRTTSSYPAITIFGVASSSTRYSTNIYRDATYLQIGSSVYISGNLVITGNSASGSASDRRLKEDIKTIDINRASEIMAQLRPVEFDWNKKAAELGQLSGHSRGFIADEYLKLIPEAGRKIWGEYDAIDYEQAIPYIVAAWQQQNMRIRVLEGDIKTLREDNELLRRRLREHGA